MSQILSAYFLLNNSILKFVKLSDKLLSFKKMHKFKLLSMS